MEEIESESFGARLRNSRLKANLSQAAFSRQTGVSRLKIVRTESGEYSPHWDEVLRFAQVLKVSLQHFLNGRDRPRTDLQAIAFELHHLGIWDYVVDGAVIPGAFRRREEVLALILKGNQPESRLIDAIPVVLSTVTLNPSLTLSFADKYDKRVRVRLAWLSEIALLLGRMRHFPVTVESQESLERLIRRVKKPQEPDDLGHPGSRKHSIIWRRWNITYGGTIEGFITRAAELGKRP